jgi:diguanylate cyclase (GGDEF)-like protein
MDGRVETPSSRAGALRVLVVEDDARSRTATAQALRAMGHLAIDVPDAAQAVRWLADAPFDVLVCDWIMPGMSGLDLVRHVRAVERMGGRSLYIVVVSAFVDRAHAIIALREGADQVTAERLEAELSVARRRAAAERRLVAQNDRLADEGRRAARESRSDALTGASNRRRFDEDLRAICERGAEGMALALFDVDEFKAYNDALGHVAGDAVLRKIVEACHATLRQDDRLYRYGGEEFALTLAAASQDAARGAIDRFVEAIAGLRLPHPRSARRIVTVSAGVALGPARDVDAWLRRADGALYRAKRAGRGRVVVAGEDAEVPEFEAGSA